LFINAPGTPDFISNAEGNQLAYIFADPQVGIFQDVNSTDWSNGVPTHAFNRKFVPGKSYGLLAGLTSSQEEPLTNGSTIELSLYYRDASNNMVTVAATTVTYSTNSFPILTNLRTFATIVPEVKPTDAWAGKNIGIKIATTTLPQLSGGVWDVDNVRLNEFVPTTVSQPRVAGGKFGFTLHSEPGASITILGADSLTGSSGSWTNVVTITNQTGTVSFVDTNANLNEHFYTVRQLAGVAPSGAPPSLPPPPPLPRSIGKLVK
jgi:hypothetical protein